MKYPDVKSIIFLYIAIDEKQSTGINYSVPLVVFDKVKYKKIKLMYCFKQKRRKCAISRNSLSDQLY